MLAPEEAEDTLGLLSLLLLLQETRRDYRELFITAEIGEHVSGMILYKETLAQTSSQGVTFVNCLYRQGVLPGIKVDEVGAGHRRLASTKIWRPVGSLAVLRRAWCLCKRAAARHMSKGLTTWKPIAFSTMRKPCGALHNHLCLSGQEGLMPIVSLHLRIEVLKVTAAADKERGLPSGELH